MEAVIPSIVSILPLPLNQILFPHQSLNDLLIHPPLSNQLVRLLSSNQPHPHFIGCVPLKFNHPSSPNHNSQRFQIRVITHDQFYPHVSRIAITTPSSRLPLPESSPPSIDQLYDWGCIARVIKFDHSTSDQTLKLDLLGIHRFTISRHIRSDPLSFQARITTYPEIGFESHHADQERSNQLMKDFKITTTSFILLLSHSVTHQSPHELEKRSQFSQLIESLELPQISLVIDLMIRDIQFISWEIKLEFLTYYQFPIKLEKFIDLITRTSDQIQTFYRNSNLSQLTSSTHQSPDSSQIVKLKSSDSGLTPQQKELLLRYRLKAIRLELQQGLKQLNQLYNHHSTWPNPLTRSSNNKPFPIHVPFPKPNTRPVARPFIIGTRRGLGPFDGGGPFPSELDSGEDELQELEKKVYSAGMSKEAFEICSKELKRLASIPPSSIEHSVIKNYLEIMVELPWSTSTIDATNQIILSDDFLHKARAQLDLDHYGMLKVKHRLVEFLAVIKLRTDIETRASAQSLPSSDADVSKKLPSYSASTESHVVDEKKLTRLWKDNLDPTFLVHRDASHPTDQSTDTTHQPNSAPVPVLKEPTHRKCAPILLLVGPPGVGKTSIAKSIAKALHKKFYRISLGGVKDESEIRGHRRTYVGSMPGAIAQALRRVGVNDPVILLDEIDKIGMSSYNGDPASALLEVLDPEQNSSFVDHYINTPIDLSSVLFLATANTTATISSPLLDRLETIELDGYVLDEKLHIAKRNLIPKQIKNYNLNPKQFILDDDEILKKIILNYTRESGVRGLEREIGNLCRAKVLEFIESRGVKNLDKGNLKVDDKIGAFDQFSAKIQMDDLYKILGSIRYDMEVSDTKLKPGVAIGMAYEGSGNGSILYIEATRFSGRGALKLTGSLGDVIKESAELAISWIKSNSNSLKLDLSTLEKSDLHIHLPSGSIRKDGPSAGVALVLALVSLFINQPIDNHLAVTGEISLRGRVLPVGGIREKVLAAHRSGIKELILPQKNMREIEEEEESIKKVVKESMKISYVSSLNEVIELVFKDKLGKLLGHDERLQDQNNDDDVVKGQRMNGAPVQRENFQKSLKSFDSCL